MFNCYYWGTGKEISIRTDDEEVMDVLLNFMHQRMIVSAKNKDYENTKLCASHCEQISGSLEEYKKDYPEETESEDTADE